MRHCPEYATHSAPWTNTSSGSAVCRASSVVRISLISLTEHSRASTTNWQPSSRANSTPAALVIVICVEPWIGKSGDQPADQAAHPHVLHDGGVDTGGDDGLQVVFGGGKFVGEDQRVERDVAAHAAPVQELHQGGQVRFGKVVRAHPGVETAQAE